MLGLGCSLQSAAEAADSRFPCGALFRRIESWWGEVLCSAVQYILSATFVQVLPVHRPKGDSPPSHWTKEWKATRIATFTCVQENFLSGIS